LGGEISGPALDADLSILNWTQLFNDETANFSVGRLAFDAYLDAFAFQTISRGFLIIDPANNPTEDRVWMLGLRVGWPGFIFRRKSNPGCVLVAELA